VKSLTLLFFILLPLTITAQDYRWQQHVEYTMNVRLDTKTNRMTGDQRLVYYNNSNDTLKKVFYHLYFNAFQPGSMMDVRSLTISDPDARVKDRISKLRDDEIGYQHIQSLRQDGKDIAHKVDGTILEVTLAKPLLPKSKTVLDMKFESQVPIQIRRTGRNNSEGIDYSMAQWYPKMAEYDHQGWHAYQYVAREFHGVWGDFDVNITLDPDFVVAATGNLQNADKIGHGYEKAGTRIVRPSGDLTWHFTAKNVLDFVWAADTEYIHDQVQVPDGPMLHFFYVKKDTIPENWKKMQPIAVKVFQFYNERFGKYPFDTYSVIQGGDGGMEYPMATLVLGGGRVSSLVSTVRHEIAHSWFQMALGSNESLYPWMDEGFASFASTEASAALSVSRTTTHAGAYTSYFTHVKSGLQEPASQHSDHYNTNRAYSTASYTMGEIFLQQMKYLIGTENFYKGMLLYYNAWKMRHPEPNDFIRVMEKTSGLQLHWYLSYWISTTKTIDYEVGSVREQRGATFVTLNRIGTFPMPIDLVVTYKDGRKEMFYISMNELQGTKPVEDNTMPRTDLESWPWVNPSYTLKVNTSLSQVERIEIDPSLRMADINRANNTFIMTELIPYEDPTK
jgi:hypothetical protein